MDRGTIPTAEADAPSRSEGRHDLTGDELLRSEEFVEIALACFAAGVREAEAERDELKRGSRPPA